MAKPTEVQCRILAAMADGSRLVYDYTGWRWCYLVPSGSPVQWRTFMTLRKEKWITKQVPDLSRRSIFEITDTGRGAVEEQDGEAD